MKTFKEHLKESFQLTDFASVSHAVAEYKKADEILNPDYQNLSQKSKRIFEKDANIGRELILNHMRSSSEKDEDLSALYWDWPHDNLMQLNKFEKSFEKFSKKNKFPDVIHTGQILLKNWKQLGQDIKDLKSKVVKVSAKRAEAKAAKAEVMQQKFADSSSLIKCLEAHLDEYKKVAETKATQFIEGLLKNLENQGMDLNKVLKPYSAKQGMALRSIYYQITTSVSHLPSEGIRVVNVNGFHRYVDQAVKAAEDDYRAFIHKMIEKIGKPVIDAKMTGSIWTNARLVVTTVDGEQQQWNTNMIINFSKYQKMFNQFPTRRVK